MTGLMSRGMMANALKVHIMKKSDNLQDTCVSWDDVWHANRRALNPMVPRYWAIAEPDTR